MSVTSEPVRPAITFTFDLEDHGRPGAEERFDLLARQVVRLLADHRARATVFVVGELAERYPSLVREVAAAGHEIGLHGWVHEPLHRFDETTFARDTERGRELLGRLTGQEIAGYRAPISSLTPAVPWVPDVLSKLGFTYSSSILPGNSPLHGWPGVPEDPFRWESGLLEVSGRLLGAGPIRVPFCGGTYFRLLPDLVVRLGYRRSGWEFPWFYCHPYDFDPGEPMWRWDNTPLWGVPMMWFRRRSMFARVHRLLEQGVAPPFAERVDEMAALADRRPPIPSGERARTSHH